jgi:F-type H+-transporting ATPase subunit delta
MPAIFTIRRIFDELWADARKRLEVTVTSAVELDDALLNQIRGEIEDRTGREIDLEAVVDDDVLGGLVLRVGNMIFDASVRSKLERVRREVAQAA